MTVKSTSIHQLNADHKLSKLQRHLWFLLNTVNNWVLPNWVTSKMQFRRFNPKNDTHTLAQVSQKSSPSRALSDLFWLQLPWGEIKSELGEIQIVDVGCGSGRYGETLQENSGGRITTYTGFDEKSHADWQQRQHNNSFIHLKTADSANFELQIPPGTNFFMSQSAIEHFPEDLVFFQQIRRFISDKLYPILQVHLFPSSACLRLYRFHGIRQYSPRTISKIANLFPQATTLLFELGNSACNELHYEFITKPVMSFNQTDRRETEGEKYWELLKTALSQGPNGNLNQPSFYALVIHSNQRSQLFPNDQPTR